MPLRAVSRHAAIGSTVAAAWEPPHEQGRQGDTVLAGLSAVAGCSTCVLAFTVLHTFALSLSLSLSVCLSVFCPRCPFFLVPERATRGVLRKAPGLYLSVPVVEGVPLETTEPCSLVVRLVKPLSWGAATLPRNAGGTLVGRELIEDCLHVLPRTIVPASTGLQMSLVDTGPPKTRSERLEKRRRMPACVAFWLVSRPSVDNVQSLAY